MRKAILALEDGTVFRGTGIGAQVEGGGEIVFNTALSGYQEVLTDPSYCGQIVTMTYPEIGNYGIAPEDMESGKAQVAGFVVRHACPYPSNWRGGARSVEQFLQDYGIPGIAGVDTRKLVRILRTKGAQRGVILDGAISDVDAVARAKQVPSIVGVDLVRQVTSDKPYEWTESEFSFGGQAPVAEGERPLVVAYDFGIKRNILRKLVSSGFRVVVVPASTPAAEVMKHDPDGVFLSNGPGDPDAVPYAIASVRELVPTGRPMFGICLGHQIMALAMGARTYKLKFGHRGANHPVQESPTGKVEISSQNHGFAVDVSSMPRELVVSHVNLNDQTVAGMRHCELPVFSVQYHPEASPGPHDSNYLFDQFRDSVFAHRKARSAGALR